MAQSSSRAAQVLRSCLSKSAECGQAIAAAEDARSRFAQWEASLKEQEASMRQEEQGLQEWNGHLQVQNEDLEAREQALQTRSKDLKAHEAVLRQMRDDLKQKQEKLLLMNISFESNVQKEVNRQNDLKQKQEKLSRMSILYDSNVQAEVKGRIAESKNKMAVGHRMAKLKATGGLTTALSLEGKAGELLNIILEQRIELESLRSGPHYRAVMRDRFGLERAVFLQDSTLVDAMERLLRDTGEPHSGLFNGEPSRCTAVSRIKVTRVLRVANPQLWRQYAASKEYLKRHSSQPLKRTSEIRHLEKVAFGMCPEDGQFGATPWICNDKSVNEMLLFHGTRASTAESIATDGFDIKRVRSGLYGNGFYFACEACKSFQYSQEDNLQGEHCILVARVVLGRPKYATGPLKGGKGDVLTNTEDSVAVFPENVPGQHHHEFVVFDKNQIFPEFIVYFTT